MLYKIRQNDNTFDINPGLHAIPEFDKLDDPMVNKNFPEARDRRIKYVILYADRKSPLRSLPDKQRREKAAQLAGYKMEGNRLDRTGRDVVAGEFPVIEAAIAKYRELQWDEDQDTLDTVVAQIQEIKDYMKSDKTKAKDYGKALEQATKLGEKLPVLIEAKQKLEELLQISENNKPEIQTFTSQDFSTEVLDSEENLSTIDMAHQQGLLNKNESKD